METLPFLSTTLSIISLLLIASITFTLATRYRLPYTVLLVAVGILIWTFAPMVPGLWFLDNFELTPDILLYVFLPVLLFESAYNLKFRDLINNIWSISLLAVASLFLSACIIGWGIYYAFMLIGIPIPFLVALLFGSLISATDPVSVLALFKELWAPKRLTLIFEWESLFNDGTALALFLVVLSFFALDSSHTNYFVHFMDNLSHNFDMDLRLITGFLSFVSMVGVWILFGAFIGFIFSRSIHYFGKNKILELTLTMMLAHLTFILADVLNHFILPVSGVIATTIAAIVVWNYGRYKLSHDTRHAMAEYWEFFAFVANSIVFLLVWVMIISLHISWLTMIIPIVVTIVIVILARAISIYGVVIPWNLTKIESHIPYSWMHLLSWGSLRWSLAIVMALLIPPSLVMPWENSEVSIQAFILALTVWSIVFTTFIKATTITPMIRHMQIDRLSDIDRVSYIESKIFFLLWVIARIEKIANKWYFPWTQKQQLENRYIESIAQANQELEKYQDQYPENADDVFNRVVSLYALHSERVTLLELFSHGEIDEILFRYQLEKIEWQIDRIEAGKTQLKDEVEKSARNSWWIRIMDRWMKHFEFSKYKQYEQDYIKHRTRVILLERVLEELNNFNNIKTINNHKSLIEIRQLYWNLLSTAINKRTQIRNQYPDIMDLEANLIHNTILQQESDEIETLIEHEVMSKKVWEKLLHNFS